jgi:hypothetical protein
MITFKKQPENTIQFAIRFGIKIEGEFKNSLEKMKGTKNNKQSPLVKILRKIFDEKSDARTEYRLEFRTFIISSLCAINNDIIRTFKSMMKKCSNFNINLWLKGAVCKILKGSWAIWIGGIETVYNIMKPRFDMKDLEKHDQKHKEEGCTETEEESECRNLRILLYEEMEASYVGFAEDKENHRQPIVNASTFKDYTEALVLPGLDLKDEIEDTDYEDADQVYETTIVADDKERNSRQIEMEAGFNDGRNPEEEEFITAKKPQ